MPRGFRLRTNSREPACHRKTQAAACVFVERREDGLLDQVVAELDGIAAVKVEQSPSPTKISGILEAAPRAACYGGLGGLYLLEELDRGAVGVMTGFAFPEVLVDIHRRYAAGDADGAWAVFHHWMPLIRYEAQLGVGGVGIRKQLLRERGVIASSTVRRPVAPGDPRSMSELRNLVTRLSSTNAGASAPAER